MVGETHELVHLCSKMNRMGLNTCQISKTLLVQKNPSFMGARAFMHATKKGYAFLTYALPAIDAKSQQHEIPSQYKAYKDVFEKKNVDILP
jgi:hypothetical protein